MKYPLVYVKNIGLKPVYFAVSTKPGEQPSAPSAPNTLPFGHHVVGNSIEVNASKRTINVTSDQLVHSFDLDKSLEWGVVDGIESWAANVAPVAGCMAVPYTAVPLDQPIYFPEIRILLKVSAPEMSAEINQCLDDGWFLHGPLSLSTSGLPEASTYFCQMVVRQHIALPEEDNETEKSTELVAIEGEAGKSGRVRTIIIQGEEAQASSVRHPLTLPHPQSRFTRDQDAFYLSLGLGGTTHNAVILPIIVTTPYDISNSSSHIEIEHTGDDVFKEWVWEDRVFTTDKEAQQYLDGLRAEGWTPR